MNYQSLWPVCGQLKAFLVLVGLKFAVGINLNTVGIYNDWESKMIAGTHISYKVFLSKFRFNWNNFIDRSDT